MARRLLHIRPLDTFRLMALLKATKPRRASAKESLVPLRDNLAAYLSETEPKAMIDEAAREAITETVNFPPPVSDAQRLADMGYTAPTYAKLAAKLTDIVQHYNPSEAVLRSDVKGAATVVECVDLVVKKAGVS